MHVLSSPLFPTLVWTTVFEDRADFNRELLQRAYALRARDPRGVRNTNVQGWQSANTIQGDPDFGPVCNRITAVVRQIAAGLEVANAELRLQAWVNISPPGAWNRVHVHPGCHFSGVYYVRTPPGSGHIYFRDPRVAATMLRLPVRRENHFTASEASMPPEEGRLYVFPAWLEHGVQPNTGDSDRVGVSFNVLVSEPVPAQGARAR